MATQGPPFTAGERRALAQLVRSTVPRQPMPRAPIDNPAGWERVHRIETAAYRIVGGIAAAAVERGTAIRAW